jgi:hypothetical protein
LIFFLLCHLIVGQNEECNLTNHSVLSLHHKQRITKYCFHGFPLDLFQQKYQKPKLNAIKDRT